MIQSKKIKALAILGSPHSKGITSQMLAISIDECINKGYEVTTINLYEKKINYCLGCRQCYKNNGCIFKNDDIEEITNLVKESDLIILASPVYWANVPAVVKNLFDRLLGVAMEETKYFPKPRLTNKSYLLLTACNTPRPFNVLCKQSSRAISSMKEFFKTGGLKYLGKVVCSNTKNMTILPEKYKRQIKRKIKWE